MLRVGGIIPGWSLFCQYPNPNCLNPASFNERRTNTIMLNLYLDKNKNLTFCISLGWWVSGKIPVIIKENKDKNTGFPTSIYKFINKSICTVTGAHNMTTGLSIKLRNTFPVENGQSNANLAQLIKTPSTIVRYESRYPITTYPEMI